MTKNLGEAYKQYLASAEKGDVLSEATVGWMLRNGQGVTRDYKKCLEWYTKAADKGHVNHSWEWPSSITIPSVCRNAIMP